MTSDMELPALLGGIATRLQGPPGWPPDWADVKEAVDTALSDGSWGRYDGPHSEALIERLAADHAVEHVVLCSSGTVAVAREASVASASA